MLLGADPFEGARDQHEMEGGRHVEGRAEPARPLQGRRHVVAGVEAADESRFGQGKLANFDLRVRPGDQGALPYGRDPVRA
jgi:hypothetical protein